MKKIRWDLLSIIGGIAGVLVGVFVILRTGGPRSIYIATAMVAVFGGMGFLFYKLLWGPRFNVRRLQKTGIPGKAKILEVHDTNIAVNNNPQVKLVMEVKNNSGQVYTTSCKTIVSRRQPGYFQPGKEVNIKIDPKNEMNVIIDISGT
jgi:outer membrane lipoprotein SlyB